MDEQKIYHRYANREDKLEAWREQRIAYDEWRHTPEGEAWVRKKAESQLGLCFICLTPLRPPTHVDHIFPLYAGGTSASANMCITHADCNIRKGATVYMTYNQACRRRKLFNDLRHGVKLYRTLKAKPLHIPGKRGVKCLQLAKQYFSEQKLDTMDIDCERKRRLLGE